MKMAKKLRLNLISYSLTLIASLVLGAFPAALVFGVDPYEIFRSKDRTTKIQDIAEKAHYPLWKLAKYQKGQHNTIILGDSRARALRDKYWHELGMKGALNLAYGGGTIPEIYSTFQIIKDDDAVENLVVGIQLRSFDEEHKKGMNRVPEAKFIVENRPEYLKNWSVFKTAWNLMTEEEKATFERFEVFAQKFSISARAEEYNPLFKPKSDTLDPDFCQRCDLTSELLALSYSGEGKLLPNKTSNDLVFDKNDNDWPKVSYLYQTSDHLSALPEKMARQVTKNAKSDWQDFQFSRTYWSYLEEISTWAHNNQKNLIFVIPPTIEDMQRTISLYGLEKINHDLRVELSRLGSVIDLDFSNELTTETNHFSDAYHFNSKISKKIVGEIVAMISPNGDAGKLALKRSDIIRCHRPEFSKDITRISDEVNLTKGDNCRIWRAS